MSSIDEEKVDNNNNDDNNNKDNNKDSNHKNVKTEEGLTTIKKETTKTIAATDENNSLESVLIRLLDKAGKDPRCTLKLLREKTEKKLSLPTGSLKLKREEIKNIIYNWWEKEELKEKQAHRNKLALFVKLAKAAGHAPAIFKGVKELPTDEERVKALSQKLSEKGLKFSEKGPTEEEIEEARKAYELKKDMDGIDPSAIIETGKKRTQKVDGHQVVKKKAVANEDDKPIHKAAERRHNLDLDEEADF